MARKGSTAQAAQKANGSSAANAAHKILLVQGPNLTFLGRREPHLYGSTTAAQLDAIVRAHAARLGCTIDIFYSHIEGEAIARIYQGLDDGCNGLLMNPAGFMYAGYAMRDCLSAIAPYMPYVEVHITNIETRGLHSILAEKAVGYAAGFGVDSYLVGLDALARLLDRRQAENSNTATARRSGSTRAAAPKRVP